MAIISISDSQINGADQVLVADASSKIPAKDGSQITILSATNVSSGTIATARLDTGTAANKIVVLDGSGNLPVIDGSQLTGVSTATLSASDPTISTNPSGGVGTEWNNSTTGKMYICTDATAGANVWTNVGKGLDNIRPLSHAQGESYGYSMGGYPGGPSGMTIEKYSFTTTANSTDISNLDTGLYDMGGHNSTTHGYTSGGQHTGSGGVRWDYIQKFPFASNTNASDWADLFHRTSLHGATMSTTYGYCAYGYLTSPSGAIDIIQKFTFASQTNGVDVGNMGAATAAAFAVTSATHGYAGGGHQGYPGNTYNDQLEKWSYATDANSTDVGDMTNPNRCQGGLSTTIDGYRTGGGDTYVNIIDKINFASGGNMTEVGDLSALVAWHSNSASTTHGYVAGGYYSTNWPTKAEVNTIQKFSFASGGNAVDTGADLVATESEIAGCQD